MFLVTLMPHLIIQFFSERFRLAATPSVDNYRNQQIIILLVTDKSCYFVSYATWSNYWLLVVQWVPTEILLILR